jgi:hypothetical protein
MHQAVARRAPSETQRDDGGRAARKLGSEAF